MFVPSLSWQNVRFVYINGLKRPFFHLGTAAHSPGVVECCAKRERNEDEDESIWISFGSRDHAITRSRDHVMCVPSLSWQMIVVHALERN